MKIQVRFQENNCSFRTRFSEAQVMTVMDNNYENLENKPSINSIPLVGNLTSEDLGIAAQFPTQGSVGDVLTKTTNASDGVSWVTPASDFNGDNTRPMTAAGVYTQIGNINALLASI